MPDAGPPECGNGVVEDGEVCDGAALGGYSCATEGFVDGRLTCRGDCGGYLTSGCSSCGDGEIQPLEACDGDTVPTTCEALG